MQHLAFTDGKPTAVGISGKKLAFNSMSLANLLWGSEHFFWNGRANSLEQQALIPIQDINEMGQNLDELVVELNTEAHYKAMFAAAYGDINADNIAKALSAFERTLVSSHSKYDQYLRGEATLTDQETLEESSLSLIPTSKLACVVAIVSIATANS
jgi:cytochrome c peroxidase